MDNGKLVDVNNHVPMNTLLIVIFDT